MQMKIRRPAVLSLSGLSRAVTPTVYGLVKVRLGQMLKKGGELEHLKDMIVFLDSPFTNTKIKFSHPLEELNDFESSLSVVSRLLQCWVLLNSFNEKVLVPVLAQGKVVILLRYGLDAFLYSLLNCEERDIMNAVATAHHALVDLRVKAIEIPNLGVKMEAPYYLIPWGTSETITSETISTVRILRGRDIGQVRNLVSREQGLINNYCREENGQRPAWYLDGATSDQYADCAIRKIVHFVERGQLAA